MRFKSSYLRRVARVYMAKKNKGLQKYQPNKDAALFIMYEPVNKIYMVGTYKQAYKGFYTKDSDEAIQFAKAQLEKWIPGFPTVETTCGVYNAEQL